ncbi:hypothetical protein AgCh_036414 [Apium graveolens]
MDRKKTKPKGVEIRIIMEYNIKPKKAHLTNFLHDIRNRTLDAVDLCCRKFTVGDVVCKAGIKVDEAQKALQAVAAESDGYLDFVEFEAVTTEVVNKSVVDRVVRFAFGATLLVSIALACSAIIVMLASKSDKNDNSNEDDDSDENDEKRVKVNQSSSKLFFVNSSPSSFSEEPKTPVYVEDDDFVNRNEEFINLDDDLVDVEDENDENEVENEVENDSDNVEGGDED